VWLVRERRDFGVGAGESVEFLDLSTGVLLRTCLILRDSEDFRGVRARSVAMNRMEDEGCGDGCCCVMEGSAFRLDET